MHGFNNNSNGRRFDRLICDLQVDIPLINFPVAGVMRLMSAYLWANDDLVRGGSAHDRTWYAQAMFTSMSKGEPKWVPIIRFDEYTKNNGAK